MGVLAYGTMPRDSMPPYTIRVASVVTGFPGAGPERVEALITSKIEEVAQELPELDYVASESRTGLSIVSVALTDDVTVDRLQPVWDRLRRKIESIESDLPAGIRGPTVKDDGLGVVFGIMVGIVGEGFTYAELEHHAEKIRDDIIKLPDASEVELRGIQQEQIFLEFNNARLADLGLSANMLKNTVTATNIVFSGGEVSLEDKRIVLEPTGSYDSLEELGRTIVPIGQEGSVILGDIAHIVRDYKTPRESLVSIDGQPGIALSIALKPGANIVNLGSAVDLMVSHYNRHLPMGISLRRMASQDYEVTKSVNSFVESLLQSLAIVMVTMLVFLGLRTGLVVASLIPATILLTFCIMGMFGLGLNQVSLAALIMALGMLVDNAIVVSESVLVKMERGATAREAAITSSQELAVPLLVSSLTTSAAFLSFFLAESVLGEMMGQLFSVITVALLSSWVLSLAMVLLLAVLFIKVKPRAETANPTLFDRFNDYYKAILLIALRRPFPFICGIVGLFLLSLLGFGMLPFVFFPDSERNLITLDLNLPLGTKIEKTESAISQIETYIRSNLLVADSRQTGVMDWSAYIGEGPASYDLGYQPGETNSGYAHMLINTRSHEDNQSVIDSLDTFCFNNLPDANVRVSRLAGGGGGGADVQVRISGEDPGELFRLASRLKQRLQQIAGTQNIGDDWGPRIRKFVVDIDQARAQRAGLTNQDIALSLQTMLTGFNVGGFRQGDQTIPILLRSETGQALDVRQLESVSIYAQGSGRNVPLGQVADILPAWQYARVKRRDLHRTLVVECDVQPGYTATDITEVLLPLLHLEQETWKQGYTFELGGESEKSSDAMGAVIDQLPLSGFIILLLLVLQFNSFRRTAIVLSTIPLGVIGVVLGLLLFRSYFGFFAFLGLISLAGIVINNAIVLIDRIETELGAGTHPPQAAIVTAAQQRFRPILLTTFTTTFGLVPLYLGGGLMWEPMAISIMVGLLFATVITLLVVPVLYRLLFRIAPQ